MGRLLTPAHVVEIALVVLVVEVALLALRRGRPAAGPLAAAAAGLCLLLAVRLALAGNGAGVIALVALGGLAHLAERAMGRGPRR